MTEQIRGLVIRTTDVGDFDSMISLLTPERGRISVFVRGVKRPSSRFLAAAQLFTYGTYTLYRGKHYDSLNDCDIIESFFQLRQDIITLSLATYFCEVAADVCLEESDESSMLRLTLNALWCLKNKQKPPALIKGAFELRCACIIGFLPQLGACRLCGKAFGEREAVLDLLDGTLLCDSCSNKKSQEPSVPDQYDTKPCLMISNSTLAAMRYVITTAAERQFSFQLEGDALVQFGRVCEAYLLAHVDHGYHALTFYHSVDEKE